ncbi:MAG: hypothetical protein OSB62_04220 [Alphaproteobacteria bacterium]|nr:hypothetical protein [Alphaproteobacteria bacterium]
MELLPQIVFVIFLAVMAAYLFVKDMKKDRKAKRALSKRRAEVLHELNRTETGSQERHSLCNELMRLDHCLSGPL